MTNEKFSEVQTARQADHSSQVRRLRSSNRAKVATTGLLLVVLSSTADVPQPKKDPPLKSTRKPRQRSFRLGT